MENWLSLRSFSKMYFSLISRGLLPGRGRAGATDDDDSDILYTDSVNTDSVSSVLRVLRVSTPSVSSSESSGVALADFGNAITGGKRLLRGMIPIASAQC